MCDYYNETSRSDSHLELKAASDAKIPGTSVCCSDGSSTVDLDSRTSDHMLETSCSSFSEGLGTSSVPVLNDNQLLDSLVAIPSTSQGSPIVCSDSDSDSSDLMFVDYEPPQTSGSPSDLMITGYEKPWLERSPVKLSSGEESDPDIMITKTEYVTDSVNPKFKRKEPCNIPEQTEKETSEASSHVHVGEQSGVKHKHNSRKAKKRYKCKRSKSNNYISRSYEPLKIKLYRTDDGSNTHIFYNLNKPGNNDIT